MDNNLLSTIINKKENGIRFSVRAVPNASKCEITGIYDGCLRIRLDAPPNEGKANEKCIKFLSKLLDVPKSNIEIISGDKNKNKIIEVKGNPDILFEKIKFQIKETK